MHSPAQPTAPATLVFMPHAAIKGRGTAWAIEHRFTSEHHESFDDGWGTLEQAAQEEQSAPGTQIIEQKVKSILSGNDSPDIPFDLSINPYRGCEHGCVYCFARPTHSYLNLSPGLDFETKIIAKVNAVERLRASCRKGLRAAAAEHRFGHRRLPARRAAAAHHARADRGARRVSACVFDHHQVIGGRARHRSARAAGARQPGSPCTSLCRRSTANWRASWSRAPHRRSGA